MVEDLLAKLTSRVDGMENSSSHLSTSPRAVQDHSIGNEPSPQTCDSGPHTALEAEDPTDGIGSVVFNKEENSTFLGQCFQLMRRHQADSDVTGPTSNIAFTRLIVRTTNQILYDAACDGTSVSKNGPKIKNHVIHISRPSSPGPDLLNFTSEASIKVNPFFLPPDCEMRSLIELYFTTTGVLYPFIERQKFLETYQQMIDHGICSVRRSWLGLLNIMFAMATSANSGYHHTVAADPKSSSDYFYKRAMILSDRQIRYATSLEVGKRGLPTILSLH